MSRFEGLDRFRGLALLFMLVHHAVAWTSGGDHARRLLGFADGMAVTDLAAPMFAVAVGGASACLLGYRLRGAAARGRRWAAARRWVAIGTWGVAIGIVIDHQVDSFGVLEALAVSGAVVTLLAVALAPPPAGWGFLALGLTVAAQVVVDRWSVEDGALGVVLAGGFPVVTYLALAAWGAAAVGFQRDGERAPVLAAAAATAVVAGVVLGTWPPDRHPGGLGFLVPGVAASMALWAVLGAVGSGWAADALARAGRRTLLVFVGHYLIRFALYFGGWAGALRGPGWIAAAVVAAFVVFAVAAWPERSAPRLEARERGNGVATAALVPSSH